MSAGSLSHLIAFELGIERPNTTASTIVDISEPIYHKNYGIEVERKNINGCEHGDATSIVNPFLILSKCKACGNRIWRFWKLAKCPDCGVAKHQFCATESGRELQNDDPRMNEEASVVLDMPRCLPNAVVDELYARWMSRSVESCDGPVVTGDLTCTPIELAVDLVGVTIEVARNFPSVTIEAVGGVAESDASIDADCDFSEACSSRIGDHRGPPSEAGVVADSTPNEPITLNCVEAEGAGENGNKLSASSEHQEMIPLKRSVAIAELSSSRNCKRVTWVDEPIMTDDMNAQNPSTSHRSEPYRPIQRLDTRNPRCNNYGSNPVDRAPIGSFNGFATGSVRAGKIPVARQNRPLNCSINEATARRGRYLATVQYDCDSHRTTKSDARSEPSDLRRQTTSQFSAGGVPFDDPSYWPVTLNHGREQRSSGVQRGFGTQRSSGAQRGFGTQRNSGAQRGFGAQCTSGAQCGSGAQRGSTRLTNRPGWKH